MKKKLFIFFSFWVFVFVLVSIGVHAEDKTSIEPSNGEFERVKDLVFTGSWEEVRGYSESGSITIFHYKAQGTGYYAIYSTGNTDTVGRVFKQEKFLWWSTSYKPLTDSVDDYTNNNSTTNYNFKIIVEFNKGEDYYIGVRAYGSKSGNYSLIIEPNDDAISSDAGGVWKSNTVTYGAVAAGKNMGVISKTYYTKEQVKIMYQLIRNEITNALIHNYYISEGAIGVLERLNEIGGVYISIIPLPYVTGVLSSFTDLLFTETINQIFYMDINEMREMLVKLNEVCGAGYVVDVTNGADIYYCDHGLLIEENGFVFDKVKKITKEYYVWDSDKLYGVKYDAGTWK